MFLLLFFLISFNLHHPFDTIHQNSNLDFIDKKFTKELPENTRILSSLYYIFRLENFSYFHFILILLILISIIILPIYIKRNYIDNTFVFVILGDSALEISESSNEVIISKCINYCLSSYALLIKRLAIKYLGINEQHICILGKGNEAIFDISAVFPDNMALIQLSINEIYTTKYLKSELNLQKFQNISTLISTIKLFLLPFKYKKPNILLFLSDYGDENKFGELNLLNLYLKLSNIPHSSLQIYYDCYKRNSMLIAIKKYFEISEVINSFWTKITPKELYFLQSVVKELYSNRNSFQWDLIRSLDHKYYNYFYKIDKYQSFEIIKSSEDYLLFRKKVLSEDFYSYFSNDDINSLIKIIKCYKSEYSIYPQNYKEIHNIFTEGIKVVKKLLSKYNYSNDEFIQILDSFKDNISDFTDIKFKKYKKHSIISSSHQTGSSPNFGTIRVNEYLKIIAGSPAMRFNIKEALIKRSRCKNSINKMVYCDYQGLIMEYTTQGCKKWIRLFIDYRESNSFVKKILFVNQNTNNDGIDIKNIMRSVDFHLCDSCHIEFNKMQLIKKENRKKNNVLNQEYDFSRYHIDNDDYYSDDGSKAQTNTLDSPNLNRITTSSSFEEFFDSFDYDMAIPSEYIHKITQDIPQLDSFIFPLRFYEVFKYELKKICESSNFNNKYPRKINENEELAPERFKRKLRNWIMYFFPSYTIISEINDLMNLFYKFTVNFVISEEDYKKIFYKCMNVADQVASQLSHVNKKAAYYIERLKYSSHDAENNIHVDN